MDPNTFATLIWAGLVSGLKIDADIMLKVLAANPWILLVGAVLIAFQLLIRRRRRTRSR